MNHSKLKQTSQCSKLTLLLLIIYLIALTWIILLKFSFSFQDLPHLRNINLVPINLVPYGDSLVVNGRLSFSELFMNMVVFIPLGLYLSMLKPDWPLWKRILPAIGISLLFEILQFVFAIGASDITDLINNSLGGAVGCLLYILLEKCLPDKTNPILIVLASIGTIGFIVLFTIIIVSNL